VLFSRRSLLGQPATKAPTAYAWKDIAARGQNLPQKSSKVTAAYAGQLDNYEGLTVNALEAIWAVEQEKAQADESSTVQPAPAQPLGVSADPTIWKAAVDRLFGPAGEGRVVDPKATQYREGETTNEFLHDKIMFMRNWPVAFRTLLEESDQQHTIAAADIAMTRLPGPAVLGGQNLAVASSSDRGDDARELIEFLASEPSQRLLMQVGGFAAATAKTYDRVEIQQATPYAETVRAAVLHSRQRLQTPHYPLYSKAVRELVLEIRANKGKVPVNLKERLSNASEGRLTPK
jgi:multiple sugar transport system substrate-binding protein